MDECGIRKYGIAKVTTYAGNFIRKLTYLGSIQAKN
jgi:hypothetical protein